MHIVKIALVAGALAMTAGAANAESQKAGGGFQGTRSGAPGEGTSTEAVSKPQRAKATPSKTKKQVNPQPSSSRR